MKIDSLGQQEIDLNNLKARLMKTQQDIFVELSKHLTPAELINL